MLDLINYRLLILIIFTLVFVACREDIIQPDTFIGTINEPVQINEPNSYTFAIHAENISVNVTNNTFISSFTSRISISIADYTSGYVSISIIDTGDKLRFSYFGNEDERSFSEALAGYLPAYVKIRAVNFSGKLKIEVIKTF